MLNVVVLLCLTPLSQTTEDRAATGATAEAPRSEVINRADEAFRAGRYQEVLPLVDEAVKDPTLPKAERARAHALAALIHTAFDRPTEAIAAYEKALEADPSFELKDPVSPKVRTLFDEAKKNRANKEKPEWVKAPPPVP